MKINRKNHYVGRERKGREGGREGGIGREGKGEGWKERGR